MHVYQIFIYVLLIFIHLSIYLMNKTCAQIEKRQISTGNLNKNYIDNQCLLDEVRSNGFLSKLFKLNPITAKDMDIKFMLFTCKNRDHAQIFSYLSNSIEWENSNFNPILMTRFVVHGFLERYPGNPIGFNWMEQMKNTILNRSCDNVIAIDWSKPSRSLNYYQSAANTRIVGQMIGCVINRLRTELNLSPNNVHLIGFSLGAHVVGIAGKQINNPKVRRITGLDPAGLGFLHISQENRLTHSDAQFVIIIHTDSARSIPILGGLSTIDTIGNADFYPNGGNFQPGCSRNEYSFNTLTDLASFIICDHERANMYAIKDQSFSSNKCQLIGYNCSSFEDFIFGKCADCGADGFGCRPMPYDFDYWDNQTNCKPGSERINYFLNTGSADKTGQFCLFHYQIIVYFKSFSKCTGSITIIFPGEKKINIILTEVYELESENSIKRFTNLYTDTEELDNFDQAIIQPGVNSSCSVSKIEINYMSNLDPSIRKSMSWSMYSSLNASVDQ